MGYQFTDNRFFVEPIEDSDQESEISECYEDSESEEELAYQIDVLLCENHSLKRSLINVHEMNKILENDKLKLQYNLYVSYCIIILSISLCYMMYIYTFITPYCKK